MKSKVYDHTTEEAEIQAHPVPESPNLKTVALALLYVSTNKTSFDKPVRELKVDGTEIKIIYSDYTEKYFIFDETPSPFKSLKALMEVDLLA